MPDLKITGATQTSEITYIPELLHVSASLGTVFDSPFPVVATTGTLPLLSFSDALQFSGVSMFDDSVVGVGTRGTALFDSPPS